ncbi:MAG: hypothetical protein Kow009_02240 [Spirochaetales bacterium]
MINAFMARLIVAASAIVITATVVGLARLAERILESARKPKVSRKPAFSQAE